MSLCPVLVVGIAHKMQTDPKGMWHMLLNQSQSGLGSD